jgi:Histidine kinase-like ATPase domain
VTNHNHAPARAEPFPDRRRLVTVPSGNWMTQSDGDNGTSYEWLIAAAETAGVTSDGDPPYWACSPLISAQTPCMGVRGIRAGREFTLATIRRWGVTERCDDIAIVVSELLTNALRHAVPGSIRTQPAWPARLGLLRSECSVLCAVADPSSSVPTPKNPSGLAESSRGLLIVGALSDKWGYTAFPSPGDIGKIVWAMLTMPSKPQHGHDTEPAQ